MWILSFCNISKWHHFVFSSRLKSSKIFFVLILSFYCHSQKLTFVLCDTNYLLLRTMAKQIENGKLQHRSTGNKSCMSSSSGYVIAPASSCFIFLVLQVGSEWQSLLSEFTNFITIFLQSAMNSRHIWHSLGHDANTQKI